MLELAIEHRRATGSRAWIANLLVAAVCVLTTFGCTKEKPAATTAAADTKFEEKAIESGVTFTMGFLAGEQGEHFKINFYDHGCGVAVADIEGDGDDDLYFSNQLGTNALYRNDGNGKFTDVTASAGPVGCDELICVSAAFNDVDNDGDQDLYVSSTRGGNKFFKNDGKGKFTDATREAGLEWIGHTQGVTFFDADNDGDLDLFIANTAKWTTEIKHQDNYYLGGTTLMDLLKSPVEPNAFFRNDGKGKFTDNTAESGLAGAGWGGDSAVFDCDDDGDLDLFVANMFGGSILFQNDGKGRFTNGTKAALGKTPWGAVGAKPFDYDGDGRLDLYVVDMHSDMWTPAAYDVSTVNPATRYPTFFSALKTQPNWRPAMEQEFEELAPYDRNAVYFGNGLYRNLGGGKFEEVGEKAGAETFWPWGIAAGDFNHDGYEDAFIPSGMGYPWGYWSQSFLKNNGDGTFTDSAAAVGLDSPPEGKYLEMRLGGKPAPRSSRSAATGDFDGDGRLDIVVNNFNDRAFLFMNHSPRKDHIAFRLEGTRSNRDAVGALVRVHSGGRVMVRQLHAAGGYLAQSSKTVHFGLAPGQTVERCEIRWPSGQTQKIDAPAVNQIHKVVETK